MKSKKVYLAGPDVFRKDAVEYGKNLCERLEKIGLKGLFPLDNEIDEGRFRPIEVAREIYKGNIKYIEECDIILANLDRFRGPSVDPGTAFELGYAKALGKQVVGYFTKNTREDYKDVAEAYVTEPYVEVEDFDLHDNLMIVYACDFIYISLDHALAGLENMMKKDKGGVLTSEMLEKAIKRANDYSPTLAEMSSFNGLIINLRPKDLIKNPHIKELVEALKNISSLTQVDINRDPDFWGEKIVNTACKALAEFEGSEG